MKGPADSGPVCAAEGCSNPIVRPHTGRPPTYCSPTCRPSAARGLGGHLVVEIDHEPTTEDTRPTGRIWMVRLRRAGRFVTVAAEPGRPSADHLACQIDDLLRPQPRAKGGAIE